MNEITVIKSKKDLNGVGKGFTGYKGAVKLDTTEERIYAFNNAEEIVDGVFKRERQGAISLIRSESLMLEKKAIMGDLWNVNKAYVPEEFFTKWTNFVKKLDNASDKHISQLLKFAEYHESSKLAGVKNVAPNQGQFNALATLVNKQTKKKDLTPVVRMYDTLVKANSNKIFKSAEAVVTAYEEYHGKDATKSRNKKRAEPDIKEDIKEEPESIYVRDLFVEEAGDCPESKYAPLEYPREIMLNLPEVTGEEWKHFVKKVSHCIHPDKGGTETDQAILNSFREMMKVSVSQVKSIVERDQWNSDYEQWKDDRGYEGDFVKEGEL